ncbi:aminotransferase class I/II-fold pyridoxal phosphate-dependent enzyme [Mongoliitalea lutea]|uniref:Putative 8-amino-7-oxononanoate synthase n=1 Tax=Mongoliitalea lutea TaxID=849756 RepID=A0A8J3CXV7_9BACT|nr:aminotransferase class I/II-fold pyridoxal phosphate-dependent enzyme [Mongoliitalea lutea]GHB42022.1 putative 8-amino-7-oxononanoate synthase [Mongoliitalea lutea]
MSVFNINSKFSREININEEQYLCFSGTDYLGLSVHPDFEKLVVEGFSKLGMNHGLSRVNNVRLSIFDEFEKKFAFGAGAEKSLVWSSGYLAGQAMLMYLFQRSDYTICSPDSHPAILPIGYKFEAKLTFKEWQERVFNTCEELSPQRILILSNSVNPLVPEVYDFYWIHNLPAKHDYMLLLDDSHAFGVTGKGIFGTYSKWKHLSVDLYVTGSLAKGLAIPAGISIGKYSSMNELTNQPIFRGASPPTAAFLYAFLKSQELYDTQQSALTDNLNFFKLLISGIEGISYNQNLPIFSIANQKWVQHLEKNQIIVSSFPYPAQTDPWINRIVLNANHTKSDLDFLGKTLFEIENNEESCI